MEKAWIPRNLNQDDSVQIGMGINVKATDLPFFAATGFPTYLMTQSQDMLTQVAVVAGVLGATYIGLRCKFKGQDLPEICLNGILYSKRKRQYQRSV